MKILATSKPLLLSIFNCLFCVACSTMEKEDPILEKPQPPKSNFIKLLIDKSLDFKNYTAHTILDSVNLDNPKDKLFAPVGIESPLIITDNATGEIMAFVHMKPGQTEVIVNAETVTNSFIHLIPAFNSINDQDKVKFLSESNGIQTYKDLVNSIDGLLKSRESIYSSKTEFINHFVALNDYIYEKYLEDKTSPSGRLLQDNSKFSEWIKTENGGIIINQVKSYTYIEFLPVGQGKTINSLLPPRELAGTPVPVKISSLEVPDDYYTVNINQSHAEANEKNLFEFTFSAIGIVFEGLGLGMGEKDCINKVALSVQSTINSSIGSLGDEDDEKVRKLILAALEGIFPAVKELTEPACLKMFSPKESSKLILKNVNFLTKIISAGFIIKNSLKAYNYGEGLFIGVDLSEKLQIYRGEPKEAWIKVVKNVELKSEYRPEEKLDISVKLEALSEYAEWEKSGFTVNWSLPPFNGTLNQPNTNTTSDGTANVAWTLPKEDNAVVTLTAEIKDKEGDHLNGSPIVFQVKTSTLNDENVTYDSITDPRDGNVYKIVKIGNQDWFAENLRYAENIPQVASDEAWAAIWDAVVYNNSKGQPAWAYYNNNSGLDAVYGKLYNWYAVNMGTLCPPGWHIPTDSEWTVLIDYLGGFVDAPKKMMSVTGWDSTNWLATNESGFTGLPGGGRAAIGVFGDMGRWGTWWSSSPRGDYDAYYYGLTYGFNSLFMPGSFRAEGKSCRCLRNGS